MCAQCSMRSTARYVCKITTVNTITIVAVVAITAVLLSLWLFMLCCSFSCFSFSFLISSSSCLFFPSSSFSSSSSASSFCSTSFCCCYSSCYSSAYSLSSLFYFFFLNYPFSMQPHYAEQAAQNGVLFSLPPSILRGPCKLLERLPLHALALESGVESGKGKLISLCVFDSVSVSVFSLQLILFLFRISSIFH